MSTDLLFENARLQGRVIALEALLESERAEVARLRAAPFFAEKKLAVAYGSPEHLTAENARLKAECQARQAENSVLAVECDSLKAEVERLRKLGTEMGKHLPDTDEANRAYIDFEAGGQP